MSTTNRKLELEYLKDILEIAEECEAQSRKGYQKPLHKAQMCKLVEDLTRLRIFAMQLSGLLTEALETEERIARGEKAERILREFHRQAASFIKGERL